MQCFRKRSVFVIMNIFDDRQVQHMIMALVITSKCDFGFQSSELMAPLQLEIIITVG